MKLWIVEGNQMATSPQYVEAESMEDALRLVRERNRSKVKRDMDDTGEVWDDEDLELYMRDLEPTSVSLVAPEVLRGQ